jgi:putative oxidoreductase
MTIFEPSSSPWTDRMLAIFRIVAALMFIAAGTMKLFGYPPPPPPMTVMPLIPTFSQAWFAGVMEMIGGTAIALGLWTRPVAFILAGEMAVAYFQGHAPQGFFPNSNNGIPAVMYCFLYLYLMFAGAGAWSLDRVIARAKRGDA